MPSIINSRHVCRAILKHLLIVGAAIKFPTLFFDFLYLASFDEDCLIDSSHNTDTVLIRSGAYMKKEAEHFWPPNANCFLIDSMNLKLLTGRAVANEIIVMETESLFKGCSKGADDLWHC